MIAVIDYGSGNVRNVCKALEHVGTIPVLTSDVREIAHADKIVLPGVGAFADCLHGLQARGLFEPVHQLAANAKPLLGICVGMQLLFDVGEEMGTWPGMGLIHGRVVRFSFPEQNTPPAGDAQQAGIAAVRSVRTSLKVPHIGWNQIDPRHEHPVLRGVQPGSFAYFVHSFYPEPSDPAHVVATTNYGYDFASVVANGSTWGIQFHPEKSQDVGLKMLRNFVEAA